MTLTIDGETYHRMDTTRLEYPLENQSSIALTDAQQLQLKDALVHTDADNIIAEVSLTYQDGASLLAGYVKDSQRDQLTALLEDENTKATVEFWYTEGKYPISPVKDFKGTSVTLHQQILHYCDQFIVYGVSEELDIRSILGVVLAEGGKFYYVDAKETGYHPYDYDLWEYASLDGYEITDEALLATLEANTAEYYSDGVGMLYDDQFTEMLSIAVLVLVFGILPGALLILAVIFLIRNKGYQRKTWTVTAGLAGSVLTVFGVLVGLFMNL